MSKRAIGSGIKTINLLKQRMINNSFRNISTTQNLLNKSNSVDQEEVNKFSRISDQWWDPKGPFLPLHSMNPTRVSYVREMYKDLVYAKTTDRKDLKKKIQEYDSNPLPFKGVSIVDVGCGGGFLSESLARLGGNVLGIDASEENVNVARIHSEKDPQLNSRHNSLTYLQTTAESLVEQKREFDMVVSMEVIEHVADYKEFATSLCNLTKPGGVIFLSTMNRTLLAKLLCITIPEHIFNVVPKGTHDYHKFVKPEEIARAFSDNGLSCKVVDTKGIWYNPLFNDWKLVNKTALLDSTCANYMLAAVKIK